MPEKNYYQILGVAETATEDEIKKAFRALAKRWHPDANKGDKSAEKRFKEISEAYDVLSDKDKRAQYDQFRKARETGFGGGPGGFDFSQAFKGRQGATGGFSFGDIGDLGDLFSSIFGGEPRYSERAGRTYRPQKGEDTVISLEISFDKSVSGGKTAITIPRDETCPRCSGSGAEPGSKPATCPTCGGSGMVSSFQGGFGVSRPCPQCLGRGAVNANPCRNCSGRGIVRETRTVTVNIPRGVREGAKIRLVGLGEPGIAGGPAGDLYLLVHISPHPDFERRGNDIYTTVTLDISEAALGARVPVRTLDGEVMLAIPAGTQPGSKLRLRGRGVKSADGSVGDHYVVVNVRVPRTLTREQRRLLEEFSKAK